MILNINYLCARMEKLCYILFFIILALLLSVKLGTNQVDILGNLGGFFTGAIVGHWLLPCLEVPPARQERAKKLAFWFGITTVMWFLAMFLFFFLLRKPSGGFKEVIVTDVALREKASSDSAAPTQNKGEIDAKPATEGAAV